MKGGENSGLAGRLVSAGGVKMPVSEYPAEGVAVEGGVAAALGDFSAGGGAIGGNTDGETDAALYAPLAQLGGVRGLGTAFVGGWRVGAGGWWTGGGRALPWSGGWCCLFLGLGGKQSISIGFERDVVGFDVG